MHFKHMAIIGVGLIGGSLALAMKKKGFVNYVSGVGRSIENLKLAKELGIIDTFSTDVIKGIEDAELIVISTPVNTVIDTLKKIVNYIKPNTIVTDVGSVKYKIVEEVDKLMPKPSRFIGAHPIAGTEKSGAGSALLGLFENRMCVLTPTKHTDKDAIDKVKGIWEGIGSRVSIMDAKRHDKILALVSHLPHVLGYSLADALLNFDEFNDDIFAYSAGSLRDYTRIAGSPSEVWRDIFILNKPAILEGIKRYEISFGKLKKMIESEDDKGLIEILNRARTIKDRIS